MTKIRLEAFSDGVFAIIITIMVLELKIPLGGSCADLLPLIPVFLSYVQSFLFISNYWVNHHHLLHTAQKVSSGMMLANLLLLFFLSLVPFCTAWVGENHFEAFPVSVYAIVLLLCGAGYSTLRYSIQKTNVWNDRIKDAIKKSQKKEMFSVVLYVSAIPLAYVNSIISELIFVFVSILWLLPDKHIERAYSEEQ